MKYPAEAYLRLCECSSLCGNPPPIKPRVSCGDELVTVLTRDSFVERSCARSRSRCSRSSMKRISQISLGLSGRLAPSFFPAFHAGPCSTGSNDECPIVVLRWPELACGITSGTTISGRMWTFSFGRNYPSWDVGRSYEDDSATRELGGNRGLPIRAREILLAVAASTPSDIRIRSASLLP